MDEIWERAIETALDGETEPAAARSLTLDGAVKCVQGKLPPPTLLEKFENLHHLSIANVGVSSLEQFPRLRNLQSLILSDNRIAGGLEFLVEAGLESLRDLDLSNNRIQFIEDLAPLAELKLTSLDLYECPVTRVKDYRSRVFGLIRSLKYLDKMDAEENEPPESEEEDEEDEVEEDDPGSGEIDGEDRSVRISNGHSKAAEGVVDVDEDDESDADEEETLTGDARVNGGVGSHAATENGFRVVPVGGENEDDEEDDDDENYSAEEIDEEDSEDDEVVAVHGIESSDDDEDGVEYEEEEEDDEEDEEVDNDEGGLVEPEGTGRLARATEGEIDGHEQGEDDGDEDDNGETGEEELVGIEVEGPYEVEDDDGEEEEDDFGGGYLMQPVAQAEEEDAGVSDMDAEEGDGEEDDDHEVQALPPSSSSHMKRKRDEAADSDDNGEDEEEDDDVVEYSKSSKKHR